MFLKRLILLNWGNLPNRSYEFGSVNLFSGGSGSGKTTMGDAIQTLMTAAYDNLYQYNPGQNETTQRGKGGKHSRTLASYILGCDDGSFARTDPTDGYIVGVFHPSADEPSPPFSALMGVRAHIDTSGGMKTARQDALAFMILPETTLDKSDLVLTAEGHESTVTLDDLEAHFIKKYGKSGFERYDKKSAYLKRLYGAFRGLDESVVEPEAKAAARSFSKFMAYKKVESIDDFVSKEVLEAKDLGGVVKDISEQLKTIHGMEKEAKQLQDSIAILKSAEGYAEGYIASWLEKNTLDYKLAQSDYYSLQQEWLNVSNSLTQKQRDYKKADADIEALQGRQKLLYDEEVGLEAQRRGIASLVQKDDLESQKAAIERGLGKQFEQLSLQNAALETNQRQTREICRKLGDDKLRESLHTVLDKQADTLCQSLSSTEADGKLDLNIFINTSLIGDTAHFDTLVDHAQKTQQLHTSWYEYWYQSQNGGSHSRYERLTEQVSLKEKDYQKLKLRKSALDNEIRSLKNKKIIHPPFVTEAVAEIRKRYPDADPSVLCDHIEVADEDWQSSVEGYLGGARFSIIVDTAFEADAIRLVNSLRGNRAKVIQGERSSADVERHGQRLDSRSIIHILEFSHEIARYYMTASYGNVLRVDTAEALRMERRALTKDGMGSGGYSMWRCAMPDEDLVFGETARLKRIAARAKELDDLEIELNSVNDEMVALNQFHQAVSKLSCLALVNAVSGMTRSHNQISALEKQIAQLELGEGEKLEEQLNEVRRNKKLVDDELGVLQGDRGKLEDKINGLKSRSSDLSNKKDESQEIVEQRTEAVEKIAEIWPDFNPDKHLEQAELEAKSLNKMIAKNTAESLDQALNENERNIDRQLKSHNENCRAGDGIFYRGYEGRYDTALFKQVCAAQKDIAIIHKRLKNNVLIKREKDLSKIRKSFDNSFISHFCYTIHQALNSGKAQIEQLNRELKDHEFGADRERFEFSSSWMPEFREYARFFKEVIESPTLGEREGLFDDGSVFSEAVLPIRDKIKSMLLDNNSDDAQRELKRISDYRNYRCYEIYKNVEGKEPIPLSQYGTGSGGQLETPAYIIRSASITSAFRFSEGQTHLRMVLVDEAFSFMDESRSKEIINYLTQSLGLQLIFIMPSNKSGPFIDLVNNQFIYVKCLSPVLRGELKTQVQVDAKVLKQEEIGKLWQRHKESIYQQGELSFMANVLEISDVDR